MQKIIAVIFFLFLISCRDYNVTYSKEFKPASSEWRYSDEAMFNIISTDSIRLNDIVLMVTHRSNFGFENLYVNIETKFPDASKVVDRVSLSLSDNKGNWLGNCNDEKCVTQIYLQENIKFKIGDYQLRITQDSRSDSLVGIESLKLEIREHK